MIGREKEVGELNRLYHGQKAELVAVYGRRRVGKTYLIDETFRNKITFRHSGLSPFESDKKGLLKEQLNQFYYSLLSQGMKRSHRPESWLEAFFMLEMFLQDRDNGDRQVIFLDELPWLDTPRSGFMTAFEGFWNNWCCHRKNVMVIVCGSASSWIRDKLINNHGGLYGRVTYEIKLSPFTLNECEEYLKSNDVYLSRYDISQSYMILGGIPYYLGNFDGGKSFAQNVDRLFFTDKAKLSDEFDRLFDSTFDSPEFIKSIVRVLYTRNSGFTRKEITERLGISDGSRMTESLRALIASDFVVRYVPFGFHKNEEHYKLVDPFCNFWLHFMNRQHEESENYWLTNQDTPAVMAWRGLTFELVCFNHISQIKNALGISGVYTRQSAWSKRSDDTEGTQIDLLIERNDNILNSCEIKFTGKEFKVDKDYYMVLIRRKNLISEMISPKISVHNTLITTFGLIRNEYSGIFTNVITLNDLFS